MCLSLQSGPLLLTNGVLTPTNGLINRNWSYFTLQAEVKPYSKNRIWGPLCEIRFFSSRLRFSNYAKWRVGAVYRTNLFFSAAGVRVGKGETAISKILIHMFNKDWLA